MMSNNQSVYPRPNLCLATPSLPITYELDRDFVTDARMMSNNESVYPRTNLCLASFATDTQMMSND